MENLFEESDRALKTIEQESDASEADFTLMMGHIKRMENTRRTFAKLRAIIIAFALSGMVLIVLTASSGGH